MRTGTGHLTRRGALGAMGAALLTPRVGFAGGVETLAGAAFGTRWRIVAREGADLARLRPGIAALFDGIDRVFSPWRAGSAISRFNAGTGPAQDPALRAVTGAALAIARASDGAFDPTVGPLVARWGFGPIARGGAPDWRALSLGARSLAKARADLTLDLCGIAKGHALDRAAELIRAAGFDDLLFELGGEFLALGRHPDGRDWRVAVEGPPTRPAPAALRLPAGAAVATSGVWTQSYRRNGRLYSHIVDPRTRAPAAGGLRAVTVVAEDATRADGWATALCAAGETAGPDIAATRDIAALFLIETDGGLRQVRTGAIADMIL
ncbi:FAD:protein FMN transferase [Jannaschia ovalis]|uniref:FAD:protein FMN transferase n=1 Tax=Jannaschia ovalis TaxID=3038773 RepID=A0ABY8LB55_9RHOB|nr:FAD:protein FMN transferase [Jannaschia sp. GRR-S6-38]WGH78564.1 FAD:protein FMN transferase [Jannaschia sp. GRR-S6-38]